MSLGQLSEAALYTNDLAAAERFYHEVLGLEIISRMEGRGISFRCGATVLLVFDPARTRIPDAGGTNTWRDR
jgi:catechol 2,3-dioxygenase-like lactoylglutathione lyase family enzyme